MCKEQKCEDGGHLVKVWLLNEEPKENSSFLGVCMKCGLTMTLPVTKIEEAFQNV